MNEATIRLMEECECGNVKEIDVPSYEPQENAAWKLEDGLKIVNSRDIEFDVQERVDDILQYVLVEFENGFEIQREIDLNNSGWGFCSFDKYVFKEGDIEIEVE